jgi:xylulokinase
VVVSIGTSGTVFASPHARRRRVGRVAGFADATGRFLPLVCTLNAARVLDAAARCSALTLDALAELALSAPAGRDGLVAGPVPGGERTPNRPNATGALHACDWRRRPRRTWPGPRSKACSAHSPMASTPDGDRRDGCADRAQSAAAHGRRRSGRSPRDLRSPGAGAGTGGVRPPTARPRQAAWVALGSADPPDWTVDGHATFEADPTPAVREAYARARELVSERAGAGLVTGA